MATFPDLPGYRILERLGAGGFGVVYLAEHLALDRLVAVKVLHDHITEAIGSDRFRREAQLAAKIDHPHVVRVYDFSTASDRHFLVLEYVQGHSFQHLLRHAEVTLDDRLNIIAQAAEGLTALHAAGIVHRDFKPANLLVDDAGRCRLADLGQAMASGHSLTATARPTGTAAFIPPEVWLGQAFTPAGDLWSLGVTLYLALENRLPYQADTDVAIGQAVLHGAAPQVTNTSAPGAVRLLVLRCLAHDPAQRPSADQVAKILRGEMPAEAVLTPIPTAGPLLSSPDRPKGRTSLFVGMLVAMVVLAILTLAVHQAWWPSNHPAEPLAPEANDPGRDQPSSELHENAPDRAEKPSSQMNDTEVASEQQSTLDPRVIFKILKAETRWFNGTASVTILAFPNGVDLGAVERIERADAPDGPWQPISDEPPMMNPMTGERLPPIQWTTTTTEAGPKVIWVRWVAVTGETSPAQRLLVQVPPDPDDAHNRQAIAEWQAEPPALRITYHPAYIRFRFADGGPRLRGQGRLSFDISLDEGITWHRIGYSIGVLRLEVPPGAQEIVWRLVRNDTVISDTFVTSCVLDAQGSTRTWPSQRFQESSP